MQHLIFALALTTVSPEAVDASVTTSAASSEEAAVRAAVLDYVEAFYKAEPERARRSVAPELDKIGHYRNREGQSVWSTMSYAQLLDLAARLNANGGVPADAPKQIQILDVGTRIASAKLTAMWGVDYLLLIKGPDSQWRIRQVVWEAPSEG